MLQKLNQRLPKDRRRLAVIVVIIALAGFFLVSNLSTIDYNSVTVKITTAQGYVSELRPNPSIITHKVAWDTSDLTVTVDIEMPGQVYTINSFTFYVKETGFAPVTYEYIDRQVASQSSYTTEGDVIKAQTVISEELYHYSNEGGFTYWVYVDVIGVDYRGDFEAHFDYFYFICASPADYIDYYEDNPTTTQVPTTTTTTEEETTTVETTDITTVIDGTTTVITGVDITQEEGDAIVGFGFVSIIAVPVMIKKKRRKKNEN